MRSNLSSRCALPRRAWLLALCAVVACAIGGIGCDAGRPGSGEGPGKRHQDLALSPQEELALGRKAYREILSKSRVVREGPQVERVRRVGQRIARAAAIEPLQREINLREGYLFEWEFNVIQDKQINAFCLPGGKVAVLSGLLPVADNDDQLAAVMAHEIAHALAHHGSERLARQQKQGGNLLDALAGKAHDREQESEADHIGIFLMTFAHYDPEQAVVFWERMRSATARSPRPPEILSDHPSDDRRISDIKTWVDPAKAAKRAFDEGRIAPAPRR